MPAHQETKQPLESVQAAAAGQSGHPALALGHQCLSLTSCVATAGSETARTCFGSRGKHVELWECRAKMLSMEPGPLLRLCGSSGARNLPWDIAQSPRFLLHMSFYQDGDLSTEDRPLKSKKCSQQDKSLNQKQFQAVCSQGPRDLAFIYSEIVYI